MTRCLLLAVEIGGTKAQVALGSARGALFTVRRHRVALQRGRDGILAWLARAIPELLCQTATSSPRRKRPARPVAIGVGFGGPVDVARGVALVSHQVAGWDDFPLRRWFEERFGLPCFVENDSNAAGWGEYCCGAGVGARCIIYMNIGSGIGGALISHGQLHNPQGIGGGDIGHTWVPVPDLECGGLRADKVEHFCSGWSIEQRARRFWRPDKTSPLGRLCRGEPARIDCARLARAARQGDEFARALIEQTADVLAYAVANAITFYCPERLIIGGGAALMGEVLFAPLRRYVAERVIGPYRGRYEILPASLGQNVVLVGALLLAAQMPQVAAAIRKHRRESSDRKATAGDAGPPS